MWEVRAVSPTGYGAALRFQSQHFAVQSTRLRVTAITTKIHWVNHALPILKLFKPTLGSIRVFAFAQRPYGDYAPHVACV